MYSRPIVQPIAIIDVDETYVACASGLWCDWEVFTVPSWSVSKGRASGRLLRCILYTFSERQTRLHNKGGQSSPRTFQNEFLILKECLRQLTNAQNCEGIQMAMPNSFKLAKGNQTLLQEKLVLEGQNKGQES